MPTKLLWPRSWLKSLRLRLLAGTLLWIGATILIAGWGLNQLFQQHIQQQFQAELNLHLNQLTAALNVDGAGNPDVDGPLSDPRFQQPFSGLYWQIEVLFDGAVPRPQGVLRSRSLWDTELTLPDSALPDDEQLYSIAGPDGRAVFVVMREVQPAEESASPVRLAVAADQRLLNEPMKRFTRVLVLALSLLATGLMAAAVVQVITGLRPLGHLRRELAAVRDGQAPGIQGRFPTELQPLVDEFNGVLAVNAQVVTRARTQAGNLAHALKTPLSILGNAAEHEHTDFGRLVLEQTTTARRQVDHHLLRARAAAAVQVTGLRTPIREPLEALLRVMRRLHAASAIQIDLDFSEPDLIFRGEAHDLQEMLGNLVDNACKWASSRVLIRVRGEPDQADPGHSVLVFTVDDDGKGLIPAQRERVFKRGVRADEQAPGSGLGLAIVRDLAELYGGNALARESPLGGLGVVLRLPAA